MESSIIPGVFTSPTSTTRKEPYPAHFHTATAKKLLAKAVKSVARMDQTDGQSQASLEIDLSLRTVMSALAAGLDLKQWDFVAEAYVMLTQIEQSVREKAMPV